MNISWSQKIFSELFDQGVRDVVVCAGARNAPLVVVLSKTSGFRIHSFFEERSASFYALGIARRTHRPVAVVTTSGTAVAELLPAVIEAFHTGFPLIMLTADRPRRLRGTGAPQAIDQAGIFGKFVSQEFDLEVEEFFDLASWNRRSPIHLNICLDEPLMDEPVNQVSLSANEQGFARRAPVAEGAEWGALRLTKFLRGPSPLVVVVGTLDTIEEVDAVEEFLVKLGAPVYLEATSGLRERASLADLALRSGDKILAWAMKRGLISRVLRIGGVPTVRIWRDLDDNESTVEVFSVTSLPFPGLSRGEIVCSDITDVVQACVVTKRDRGDAEIYEKDHVARAVLSELYASEPNSEAALVHALSRMIAAQSKVYVGNSLPIREWDLAAGFERGFHVQANRGVNGIDGQLSTFFGLAEMGRDNWALIGDLTTMYDLASPWALRKRDVGLKVRIVVLNNGGGKIFNRIFANDLFENTHDIEFEHWAKMWKLDYERWTQVPAPLEAQLQVSAGDACVIELVPDNEASTRFWSRYDALWT